MTLYALGGSAVTLPPAGRYFVAANAVVLGRVVIEDMASVWFGATVRGDNDLITIGAGSNVQDGCVLHTDLGSPLTIGRNCTIGHLAMLHGCTIGEQSLVGIGAVILNGARIGRNCLIGAKALVPEGREIPDNTLALGMPAKPVRTLSEAEIAGLEAAAEHYIANWQRFVSGLVVSG